jgi:hypothetical protein
VQRAWQEKQRNKNRRITLALKLLNLRRVDPFNEASERNVLEVSEEPR